MRLAQVLTQVQAQESQMLALALALSLAVALEVPQVGLPPRIAGPVRPRAVSPVLNGADGPVTATAGTPAGGSLEGARPKPMAL